MANYQKKAPAKPAVKAEKPVPKPIEPKPPVEATLLERVMMEDLTPTVTLSEKPKVVPVALCGTCIHKHVGQPNCDAFPRQIPMEFLSGAKQHLTPVEGDNGIVYKLNTFL